jgi:hypothetical protein
VAPSLRSRGRDKSVAPAPSLTPNVSRGGMPRFDLRNVFEAAPARTRTCLATLLLAIPVAAHAEVLDKALSLSVLIVAATTCAICSYFAARYCPPLLVPVLLLSGFTFIPHLMEQSGSELGTQMAAEGGVGYVAASWLGPALSLIATVLGLLVRFGHRKAGA